MHVVSSGASEQSFVVLVAAYAAEEMNIVKCRDSCNRLVGRSHFCGQTCILTGVSKLQVGKLAKQLPKGDIKAMAAQLGGAQGVAPAAVVDTSDINEEDLT